MSEQDKIELENMIDKHDMTSLLVMLSEIAAEKADHIRADWQDETTAKCWDKVADKLGSTTRFVADYLG